jgi:hypothetical protein
MRIKVAVTSAYSIFTVFCLVALTKFIHMDALLNSIITVLAYIVIIPSAYFRNDILARYILAMAITLLSIAISIFSKVIALQQALFVLCVFAAMEQVILLLVRIYAVDVVELIVCFCQRLHNKRDG